MHAHAHTALNADVFENLHIISQTASLRLDVGILLSLLCEAKVKPVAARDAGIVQGRNVEFEDSFLEAVDCR